MIRNETTQRWCLKCWKGLNPNNRVIWSTKCNHHYCAKCASQQIHRSLSKYNTIPKCGYGPYYEIQADTHCNQPLENSQFTAILKISKKSREYYGVESKANSMNKTTFQDYGYLIYGYSKNISKLDKNVFIPKDIIALIFNFMIPICFTSSQCKKCDKNGFIHIPCKTCKSSGIRRKCGLCNNDYHKRKECWSCRGTGIAPKTWSCTDCRGKGFHISWCPDCNGDKDALILDLNKFILTQRRCGKCKKYFPFEKCIQLSFKCKHVFCKTCLRKPGSICGIDKCKEILTQTHLDGFIFCKHCSRWHINDGKDIKGNHCSLKH